MVAELHTLPPVLLPASLGEVLTSTPGFERVPYGGRARIGSVDLALSAENPQSSESAPLETPVSFISASWSFSDDSSAAEK
jgi:hypothetical protein